MSTNANPSRGIIRILAGRWARRACIATVLLLACLTTAARLRTYFITKKIQAVLHGLSQISVDQTTEAQLLKTVPNLNRIVPFEGGGGASPGFGVEISNESDWLMSRIIADSYKPEQLHWAARFADWMGYRYVSFHAGVLIHDGKVLRVRYGLSREWGMPQPIFISVKSAHGFWTPHGFPVSSDWDQSLQYAPHADTRGAGVTYTNDAPPELSKRAFLLNLSCFWNLRGCDDARELAPAIWHDMQAIQSATVNRLRTGECPDSMIEERMRYFPDIEVRLLQVTELRQGNVTEEGDRTHDLFTDYKELEAIRGPGGGSRITIHALPPINIGEQVLFFDSPRFESCRTVPATPSLLEKVRKATARNKHEEDLIQLLGAQ